MKKLLGQQQIVIPICRFSSTDDIIQMKNIKSIICLLLIFLSNLIGHKHIVVASILPIIYGKGSFCGYIGAFSSINAKIEIEYFSKVLRLILCFLLFAGEPEKWMKGSSPKEEHLHMFVCQTNRRIYQITTIVIMIVFPASECQKVCTF